MISGLRGRRNVAGRGPAVQSAPRPGAAARDDQSIQRSFPAGSQVFRVGSKARAMDKVWRRRPACGFWRRPAASSGRITGRDARSTRRRGRPMPLGFGRLFPLHRHSRSGLRRMVGAIFPEQGGSNRIEQLLYTPSVFQGPLEHRNHGFGHVQAPSTPLFGEGQQVVGMLVPAGAGRAIGANAGLTHLG